MGGSGHSHSHSGGSLASFAAKIMHPRHAAQVGVEWSWSMDLCGAERVVELPASSRKDLFAFQVEFPAREKKKTLVLAAPSAAERERWMVAIARAKRCVHPEVSELPKHACLHVLRCFFLLEKKEEVFLMKTSLVARI